MELRAAPAGDYLIFYEIFVKRQYESPWKIDPGSVKQIVDLGGNVGYSCLWWLKLFPNSRVRVYEPHPVHIAQIERNLLLSRMMDRVTLRPVAAGVRDEKGWFSDLDASSSLVSDPRRRAFEVEVRDIFQELGSAPIDILKIDIEGAEYPILRDPRIKTLDARVIALELHEHAEGSEPRDSILKRFHELGYETDESDPHTVWARRR
jgi:FkbM family methyltransferase